MDISLSYAITSLSSDMVNQKVVTAKKKFDNLFDIRKSLPENFVLKNLAHLTLKEKFYLEDISAEEAVKTRLADIKFGPIDIIGTDLDVFTSPKLGNILVVKVERTPEIQSLHLQILEAIAPFTTDVITRHERENYTPHLSVLYNLNDSLILEAKDYLKNNFLPLEYSLRKFMFMRDVPGFVGERKLIQEYLLQD